MSKGTKFIKLKKCIECEYINQWNNKSCSQCGKLFLREATEEERIQADKDLQERISKGKKAFVVELE